MIKYITSILTRHQGQQKFQISSDSEGLNFFVPKNTFAKLSQGQGDELLLYQFVHLQMLQEEGQAIPLPNGFSVPTEHAVRFGQDLRTLFGLESFKGKFKVIIEGETYNISFSIRIVPIKPDGREIHHFKTKGGMLNITQQEFYLLDEPTWAAFMAVQDHNALPLDFRTEDVNLSVIQILQQAKGHEVNLDLGHFNNFPIDKAEAVRVAAEIGTDGVLHLYPVFNTGHSAQDIASRLGQVQGKTQVASLRIGKSVVVLDEQRLRGVQEIIENHTIPSHQVADFFKSPQSFLNASLVDLETGFSLRVQGAVKFVHLPIGSTDAQAIDWFNLQNLVAAPEILKHLIKSDEELALFEKSLQDAQEQGAAITYFSGQSIDISDTSLVESVLNDIKHTGFAPIDEEFTTTDSKPVKEKATLEIEEVQSADVLDAAQKSRFNGELDFSLSPLKPYSYQEDGIRWAYGLAMASQDSRNGERIQGALLADDMGLGKTFMSLMTIAHFMNWQKDNAKTIKPTLIIAPLTLIDTWESEIEKAFHISPFKDQVVLHGARDLHHFKKQGFQRETVQVFNGSEILKEDAIRFALKVGKDFGPQRLDMPQRLVLCTYQTLRDYQFSLSLVDWGMVVIDEAQNIKNPNTLQTRAAKALKADFKLLATGTPVENSLADFWCLMDTAQPGLLGQWSAFRDSYISPIKEAPEKEQDQVRLDIGRILRQDVGPFMLRRLKAEELDGLPKKRILSGVRAENKDEWCFEPFLSSEMKGNQLNKYNTVLQDFHILKQSGQPGSMALTALAKLRAISLHPALIDAKTDLVRAPQESAKISCLFNVLQQIKSKNEKVIIFIITKRLQSMLKIWIQKHFGLNVGIINGDTKTHASNTGSETRKGLIEQFETKEGFNVIIMSPVAAGVGLTVVGANNVIHLERHWNPAKEAQATDRVYRIGQTKDVNIYIPAVHHPKQKSFDVLLNTLLMSKIAVSDAVVTPQAVSEREIINML